MLSGSLAQRLCDVSENTPMGGVFRSSWLPVMRSERLEPAGAPQKFMLVGERLVAFRAANGEVAILNEDCPHRSCSLALAKPLDDSLVCIFHGWKIHVSGKCIQTPNEADPKFPQRVPVRSYAVREAGGAIWVCLNRKSQPAFPDFLFNRLPADRLFTRVGICEYNWLTGVEGVLDPSHVALLHADWVGVPPTPGAQVSQEVLAASANLAPEVEIEPTEYGFSYAALRVIADDKKHIRVHEFVAPSGIFVGNSTPDRRLFCCLVPIDNFRTMFWFFWYTPDEPMSPQIRAFALSGTEPNDDDFCAQLRKKPLWGQDRQNSPDSFSGIDSILLEDVVAGEAQGRWTDQKREFLGPSDRAIGFVRRYLLDRVPAEGEPALAHEPVVDYASISGIATMAEIDADWKRITRDARKRRHERYVQIAAE